MSHGPDFGRAGVAGPGCLRLGNGGTLRLQLARDLLVDGLAGFGDFVLRPLHLALAPSEVGFLCRKLLLELPARLRDQRRGERSA
jgi:hypothetical protein